MWFIYFSSILLQVLWFAPQEVKQKPWRGKAGGCSQPSGGCWGKKYLGKKCAGFNDLLHIFASHITIYISNWLKNRWKLEILGTEYFKKYQRIKICNFENNYQNFCLWTQSGLFPSSLGLPTLLLVKYWESLDLPKTESFEVGIF